MSLHRRAAVGVACLCLLAAACGDSKSATTATTTAGTAGTGTTAAAAVDLSGKTVNIQGPETGTEADGFTAAFTPLSDAKGPKVNYTGSRDFETQIRVSAQGGQLPDIAVIPQPGLVKDLADKITPVADSSFTKADYDEYTLGLVTKDGKLLGVPNKGDVKSLVWYSPSLFKEKGYTVPTTTAELTTLQEKMKTDGIAPWCIGVESGDATGWPLTDWMEDFMLRVHGPDVYDQWVNHKIPFNDPKVVEVADMIGTIWFGKGNVLNGRQSIASTGFAQAGVPLLTKKCAMHRQANFYAAQWKTAKADVKIGETGDVNAFYLPTASDKFGKVTLIAGTYVVAFNNKPETLATMKYLASPEYANARIKANKGGFLSPNKRHDTTLYAEEIDRTFAKILVTASPARFDGSDQMPSEVGSGTFWKEGTNWILGTSTTKKCLLAEVIDEPWVSCSRP
jgi:alpha-glucoside transport system substrate-binding protein